jgi:hypothetical protein
MLRTALEVLDFYSFCQFASPHQPGDVMSALFEYGSLEGHDYCGDVLEAAASLDESAYLRLRRHLQDPDCDSQACCRHDFEARDHVASMGLTPGVRQRIVVVDSGGSATFSRLLCMTNPEVEVHTVLLRFTDRLLPWPAGFVAPVSLFGGPNESEILRVLSDHWHLWEYMLEPAVPSIFASNKALIRHGRTTSTPAAYLERTRASNNRYHQYFVDYIEDLAFHADPIREHDRLLAAGTESLVRSILTPRPEDLTNFAVPSRMDDLSGSTLSQSHAGLRNGHTLWPQGAQLAAQMIGE